MKVQRPRAITTVSPDANLDILRSVAVLTVLTCHFLQVIAGCRFGERFAYGVDTYALGRFGVLIFFVHTSLVLMQSMERTKLSGLPLMRHFYLRRAFRIYPLSVCLILTAIAFSIPANALGVTYQWQGWRWLLTNLLLVQDLAGVEHISGPLWSLQYEVEMYLVLPILFLALKTFKVTASFVVIFMTGVVLSIVSPPCRYVPCFLAGVIAYRLLGRVRAHLPGWLWYPALAGVVAAYNLTPFSDKNTLKNILLCLVVAALIPLFKRNHGRIAAGAFHIAKYSYGIYLCHTPILWLLYRKLSMSNWQRAIWFILAMGVLPWACFHLIEHPMIRLGTHLANRRPVKPRLVTAAAA